MMAGRNRRRVDAQLRDYVMPHDHRIAQMTGQAFGENYFNGLLKDIDAVFDSAPPIAAVLAVQASGRGSRTGHAGSDPARITSRDDAFRKRHADRTGPGAGH
jgi:protein-disulfide isomerase-like protein with CxxC motif